LASKPAHDCARFSLATRSRIQPYRSAGFRTDKPSGPIRDRRLGPIALGRLGFDPMGAIEAPYEKSLADRSDVAEGHRWAGH
jgi:hypothetical protein